jgi:hypothetical protein
MTVLATWRRYRTREGSASVLGRRNIDRMGSSASVEWLDFDGTASF